MPETLNKQSILLGIAERVVSFLAVFAIAFIWVGSTRQKVQQKVGTLEEKQTAWEQEWKTEKDHITKMDLEGSVATKNFVEHYNKEQKDQYDRLKYVEEQVGHLRNIEWRLDRLDRKIDDGKPESR